MSEINPYAPPTTDVSAGAPRAFGAEHAPRGLQEAIARLNAHLANPSNVEADRRAIGGRIRGVTIGFLVLGGVGVLLVLAGLKEQGPLLAIGAGAAIIGLLLGIILGIVDLGIKPRDERVGPDVMLKSWLKSFAAGRHGYAWACLSPTARDQTVGPPPLGPVLTGEGRFSLDHVGGMKGYAQTFANPGHGQIHLMNIKKITLREESGDVARVDAHVLFTSWPRWASIVGALGIVLVRIIGIIVYLVLYMTTRKTFEAHFTKTLIRGSDGLWYIYDGELIEGERS